MPVMRWERTQYQDEPAQIQAQMQALSQRSDLDAVIFNGGTGIALNTTYDAIELCWKKSCLDLGSCFAG